MKLKNIAVRHKVSDSDIDFIHQCLINGNGLEETFNLLEKKHTMQSIYTIASCISNDVYGINISEINSSFHDERQKLNEKNIENAKSVKDDNKVSSVINSICEDLAYCRLEKLDARIEQSSE